VQSAAFIPCDDYKQPISKVWKKSDLGYSENTFIFCSYNQPFKIDEVIFDVWMGYCANSQQRVVASEKRRYF